MSFSQPVLIVDDDPVFAAVASDVLQALGVETVLVADNGEAGIEALRRSKSPVGLVVLDLNMPKLDGLAFMRAVSLTGFDGAVILSSGESDKIIQSARNMGRMLGMKILGSLRKPISVDAVAELLDGIEDAADATGSDRATGDMTQITDRMLVPHYQPQYRAEDCSLCGAEALTRIELGDGRFAEPGGFFENIADTRRASVTALSVVQKVFRDIAGWETEGLSSDISINIDATALDDAESVPALLALAEDSGIRPESIVLELTETALPKDMSRLLESLTRLGMAGLGLSLDDYGTGGSNYEILRLCPFTELKIDMSIIQAIEHDPLSAQFVETATNIARSLNLRLVAEGVETEGQLEAVRRYGVEVVQGFLFSRALPRADFQRLLRESRKLRAAG